MLIVALRLFGRQAEKLAQPPVGDDGDAGHLIAGKIVWHMIGLVVAESSQEPFAWKHSFLP